MDYLRQSGYGDFVSQFPDERQLFNALLGRQQQMSTQLAQLQQLANYGQQALPVWQQVQDLLKQNQAKQQAAPPWWQKYWQPPEYDQSWNLLLNKDERGNVIGPPHLVQKYQEYSAFRDQQVRKFFDNPFEFFQPAIQDQARQIAEEVVRQHLGQYQDTSYANDYVRQNPWLYQTDAQGQVMYTIEPDANGRQSYQPVLSPAGRRFRQYAQELHAQGITDVKIQQQIAERLTRADMALAGQAMPKPGAQPATPSAPATPAANGAPAANGVAPAASVPDQLKNNFLQQQATTNAGAFNGRTPPADPNNPALRRTFSDFARETAKENGVPYNG